MDSSAQSGPTCRFVCRILQLFLPIVLLIGAGAYYINHTERQRVLEDRADEELEGVTLGVAAIDRALQVASEDIQYLTNRHSNSRILSDPSSENVDHLGLHWVEFSNVKKVYDKIRWIDENGRERLRVDYEKGRAVVIPENELQDKSGRYFFKDAVKLNAGEVYVSPLDLDVDNDLIVEPYKPTIRFAVPALDSNGNKRGIFLVNYQATDLLDRFAVNSVVSNFPNNPCWLLNQDGYWLKGTSKADEFGFALGRADMTMAVQHPEEWQRIQSAEKGQFETDEGLWTFATAYPLKSDKRTQDNGGQINVQNQYESHSYQWKVVSFLSKEHYIAGIGAFHTKIYWASLAVLIIFLMGIWRLVRSQRAEEEARVNLEQMVRERTQSLHDANDSLRKANANLDIERSQLHTLIEAMPDSIWLKDPQGTYLFCNQHTERLIGIGRSQILGKTDYDLVPAGQAVNFRITDMAAIENGETITHEVEWAVAGNFNLALIEITKVPIRTDVGELIGVLGIGKNITEQREALERERRLTNIHRALSAINETILHVKTEHDLFAAACRIAVNYGGMALTWIGIPGEDGVFDQAASCGSAQGYLEGLTVMCTPDHPEGRGYVGMAFRENRPAISNDIFQSDLVLPWQTRNQSYGIRSLAAIPVVRAGKPYAVFVFYSTHVGHFDDGLVDLLSDMASNISFALDGFDIEAARQRAEDGLKLAAMVYQGSSEAMVILDPEKNILAVNPAFEKITGFSAEESVGKNISLAKCDLNSHAAYHDIDRALNNDGHWKGELWNRRKNGDVFAAFVSVNTTFNKEGSVYRHAVLFSDITDKKKTEELMWRQANFDALTGLPNRRLFRERLLHEIRNSRRTGLPMALLVLDLDGFKDVNDTLGHDMGDLLLKYASERLRKSVREIDTVARLGGDEFAIILSELPDADNAERIARNVLEALSEPIELGGEVAYVSASIGITLYPHDGDEPDDLLRNADQAMYAAKREGKNRYHYFTQLMQVMAVARMRLINDLRIALQYDQFEIMYQPIVELSSGVIKKAEALIRWRHPSRGLINPVEFISTAEDTGMITSFGNWVFQEAAKQAALWREWYHPDFQISVNISPVHFKKDGIDYSVWLDYLSGLGLSGQAIVVEITEGLLLDASLKVTDQLLTLRDAGIEVSLDDFGTGYSSLSYLQKFDIDYIKIDQAFVRNLTQNTDEMALCEAIIVMSHKLGIKVIAEGIETQEQRSLLKAAGCEYGQGYLFSRPVAKEEFELLLCSVNSTAAQS